MPLDQETIEFLVQETIESALEDTKEKLNELVRKYPFKLTVSAPKLIKIEKAKKGKIEWK
ncbi:MAG: hypothetical protein K9W42_08540 [Candidatus Heimdallarchaeota archaeon]|nr:hypothetical protein [Candidatus Heimdallarchaeota archaeon]